MTAKGGLLQHCHVATTTGGINGNDSSNANAIANDMDNTDAQTKQKTLAPVYFSALGSQVPVWPCCCILHFPFSILHFTFIEFFACLLVGLIVIFFGVSFLRFRRGCTILPLYMCVSTWWQHATAQTTATSNQHQQKQQQRTRLRHQQRLGTRNIVLYFRVVFWNGNESGFRMHVRPPCLP